MRERRNRIAIDIFSIAKYMAAAFSENCLLSKVEISRPFRLAKQASLEVLRSHSDDRLTKAMYGGAWP